MPVSSNKLTKIWTSSDAVLPVLLAPPPPGSAIDAEVDSDDSDGHGSSAMVSWGPTSGAGLVAAMVRCCPDLPLAPGCGFPVLDENLRWRPKHCDDNRQRSGGGGKRPSGGIYATGALAELELGPAARNLAGARLAAERIVAAALQYR